MAKDFLELKKEKAQLEEHLIEERLKTEKDSSRYGELEQKVE